MWEGSLNCVHSKHTPLEVTNCDFVPPPLWILCTAILTSPLNFLALKCFLPPCSTDIINNDRSLMKDHVPSGDDDCVGGMGHYYQHNITKLSNLICLLHAYPLRGQNYSPLILAIVSESMKGTQTLSRLYMYLDIAGQSNFIRYVFLHVFFFQFTVVNTP